MYPLAVIGDNATARAILQAAQLNGFNDITWVATPQSEPEPALTLSANLTRVIHALGLGDELERVSHQPDREQVRFAASGYLLTELPLGRFAADRYGTRHLNIEHQALLDLLTPQQTVRKKTPACVDASLEQSHSLLLDCITPAAAGGPPSHELWHATQPFEPSIAKANMTWLGQGQTCWQFATPSALHFVFATPIGVPLRREAWHQSLQAPLESAERLRCFDAFNAAVREHWYEGHLAYLGDACYAGNPFSRETRQVGLEDAWVLSRMMDNYEEDIGDGLREYQKYRRPRVRKIAARNALAAQQHVPANRISRMKRHISLAFGTRFMPEIAMQKIDWLYSYDCIRGFR
ncbi:MAG: FAD-dependent oxidoreductase [bacterium]